MINCAAVAEENGRSSANGEKNEDGSFLALAKKIEVLGRDLYASVAKEIPISEISGIFKYLADEEQRHYEIFDAWETKTLLPSIVNTQVLVKAKKAFLKLGEQFRVVGLPAHDYYAAYKKALDFENRSVALYEEQLSHIEVSAGTEQERTVLKNIIRQEKAHALLISSLMEFNRAPGEWLENAEWRHPDEF
ncbi:MAG: ferritin family protein [Chitinispirillaceae bacterium]|jgi:rubrerythrin